MDSFLGEIPSPKDSPEVKIYKACDLCRQRKRACDGKNPCSHCLQTQKRTPDIQCIYSPSKHLNSKPENITAVSSTCNACRSKKRKCDGGLPYCTICIKSKIRDKDGLPCCVYSEKQRKKRAKNMLAASSTQSVASPNTSINGTQDFTHQPNVDVNQTESWNMPNPDSYFSISPGVFVDTKMFQNTFITPIEKVLDRPAIPAQQVFHEPSLTIIDSVYLTHLEQHLFHLSYIVLQAVPMSSTDKLHILSPTGVSPTMCKALKFALFATSVMFSNHPDLFPCGPDKISLKHRIDVARKYASRSIRCINQSLSQLNFVTIPDTFTKTVDPMFQLPFEPIDSCDLVRAMLCLAPFAYGIGEGGSAIRLIQDACYVAEVLGIFTMMDTESNSRPLWSVDSFVFRVPTDVFSQAPQNASEEQERFVLWASCLVFDTFCSMESGHAFSLDERLYPDFVKGWRPGVRDDKSQPPIRKPTLATNTVWEKGPYAQMFDRVSDICTFDLYPHTTSSTFNYVVWICVIIRRILRVVRSRVPLFSCDGEKHQWWEEALSAHPPGVQNSFMRLPRDITFESLHDSLLIWYSHIPDRARAFPSLEIFAMGYSEPQEPENFIVWSYAAPAVEGTLLFLCAFSYLHMRSLDASSTVPPTYRLSVPRYSNVDNLPPPAFTFTSRQILMTTLRALAYMLKCLMSHESPLSSSTKPSPVQYWAIQPLELFIVSSSGLLAGRVPPYNEKDFLEAVQLVHCFILPALERFCDIWPMSKHYKSKLESLLTSLQPQPAHTQPQPTT